MKELCSFTVFGNNEDEIHLNLAFLKKMHLIEDYQQNKNVKCLEEEDCFLLGGNTFKSFNNLNAYKSQGNKSNI